MTSDPSGGSGGAPFPHQVRPVFTCPSTLFLTNNNKDLNLTIPS